MSAKQLISIARRAEDGLSYAEQVELSKYILSTVREDDDEPVTRERMEDVEIPADTLVLTTDGVVWQLNDQNGMVVAKLKSMGHLRRLVAALGE